MSAPASPGAAAPPVALIALPALGLSGRIAAFFLASRLTPLLALLALLLGLWAVLVTPREEEPQIDVTMAQVFVPFPGAAVAEVENKITVPAEQVLSRMVGVEHVMAVSRPGMAMLTVQFRVGVARATALVRLRETLDGHADWLPQGLGAGPPLLKAMGIDDVPILTLTLFRRDQLADARALEQVAHALEAELKRVPGTRDVATLGGPGRGIRIEIEPERLSGAGVTVDELRRALQGAHAGAPLGEALGGTRTLALEAGPFVRDAAELGQLVVGVQSGRPVLLQDVARVDDGTRLPTRHAWHGEGGAEFPAVTIAITKKAGENAIEVAEGVLARVQALRNTLIPDDVELRETRNYGASADEKARQLLSKLLFATVSVVALVFLALGRREAAVVGTAVVLTLAATLFASWAWGFTLNRVSLFALIFSIGILVDDAIVVVENIHRHRALQPGVPLAQLVPAAVDEVGGPTILATFTVIAALLPMAFVSGLMGPYMAPIPINASLGMLLSLAIAFVVTPWLAVRWLRPGRPAGHAEAHDTGHGKAHGAGGRIDRVFERVFAPLLHPRRGRRARALLALSIAVLIAASAALPLLGAVRLKMLPFDNKSELQVLVDMPAGTPLEDTAAVLRELGAHLGGVPEVLDYQAYAGTSSPINFNGLVRQYALRSSPGQGDLQVRLVAKGERAQQSHAIATRLRPELQRIGARHGANVKVVEVPPGPPVLAPIVAEIHGPDETGRQALAAAVRHVFETTPGVVDVDDSRAAAAPRRLLLVDRRKAAMLGVPQRLIVDTLRAGFEGDPVIWLHDQGKYPAPALLQLAPERHGEADALLALTVRAASGRLVPLRELVSLSDTLREQPAYRKDGLPVNLVVADMAGEIDSPLYGMFAMRERIAALATPDGAPLAEAFIHAPRDAWRGYTLKWDGEWQITYETFRDMGAAYAVGLVLIYLLVVAQFGSYGMPLIIMAPIPLTLVGVMPGHALFGAPFTATSMIGMIALAGIIVRNSILLVDFVQVQLREGVPFERAIVRSAATRAQPIALTALAAMSGALFILTDPIFNGLAIALVFGIGVSTLLTLVLIPLLLFVAYRHRTHALLGPAPVSASNPTGARPEPDPALPPTPQGAQP